MITITNLKKTFGETVACDLPQFTVADGEILGLVGNNGAGKTTLFRLLLDLHRPDEGTVLLGDEEINPAQSEKWKQFTAAYIDESFLIDYLTPDEYFEFLAKICNITDMEDRLATYKSLDAGEIFGQKKLIRNLSAGNKQKVGIIAALLQKPRLLILDEPFNFLDPSGQNLLKQILVNYKQQTGATILVSSHNLQHTIDISSRVALMEKGHILADHATRDQLEEYFGTKKEDFGSAEA